MEYIILTFVTIAIILLTVALIKLSKIHSSENNINALKEDMLRQQEILRNSVTEATQNSMKSVGEIISSNQRLTDDIQSKKFTEIDKNFSSKQELLNKTISAQLAQLEERFKTLETSNEQKLSLIRETIEKRLNYIQEDNNKKLDAMRETVDEKLQKTLEDKMTKSFQLVNERLEQVYKGLGEMQTLAVGVGDLKKVLSNVKTRGILGEVQLGAILEEILSPEQYEKNIPTVPNSRNTVEYAIKLPGDDNGFVYMPIDSKFPADAYMDLQNAYDSGNAEAVNAAFSVLSQRIKLFAKDIRDKYIEPPHTTEFGIMFLPFEGLYAEVVNRGLVETLQRDYKVSIAGPSTMAALLNSIQMGFKTVAIQKRSSEVWKILGNVKSEFDKFGTILDSTQKKLAQANDELDKLVGVRTRAIQRSLRSVEKIEASDENFLDVNSIDEE